MRLKQHSNHAESEADIGPQCKPQSMRRKLEVMTHIHSHPVEKTKNSYQKACNRQYKRSAAKDMIHYSTIHEKKTKKNEYM